MILTIQINRTQVLEKVLVHNHKLTTSLLRIALLCHLSRRIGQIDLLFHKEIIEETLLTQAQNRKITVRWKVKGKEENNTTSFTLIARKRQSK